MLADGGATITDLALLRDQPEAFGPVASAPTAWRLPADTGPAIPAAPAGGRDLPGLVLDIDATLITCHSEKEQAAPTYEGGFGYHPLLCFPDNTGEALADLLRPGNAATATATDHITVLDQALAQIPDTHRHGTDVLIRTDSSGGVKASLTHIRNLHN
jgi:Transposase DDE domain group 1